MASWYDSYKTIKKKQEEEKNKTKAPRALVQYEDKSYSGESATRKASYEWEKEHLSDLPIKKYGRSYKDKFDKWATEKGIPEHELGEFRRFLDSREDDVDMKNESLDRAFKSLPDRRKKLIETKRENQEDKEMKKLVSDRKEDDFQKAVKEADRDGLFGFLDDTLAQLSSGANSVLDKDELRRQAEGQLKRTGKLNPVTAAALRKADTSDKILRGTGAVAGEASLYAAPYSKLAPVAKGLKTTQKIGQEFARGAKAGAAIGTMKEGFQEVNAPDEENWLDHAKGVGIEAAIGGTGDAVFSLIGRGISALRNKGVNKPTVQQVAQEVGVPEEQVQQLVQEGTIPSNVFNTTPQSQQVTQTANSILDEIAPNRGNTPSMDSFTTSQIPRVEEPLVLDDLFNFASSNRSEFSPRGLPGQADVSRGDRELIGSMGEDILRRESMLDGTQNDRLLQAQQQMDEIAKQDADQALQQQQEIFNMRQAEEDAFITQRKQPLDELMEMVSNAEAEWTRAKQSKDVIKNIKQSYGKIIIPEGNWADWGNEVPPAFRAKKGETKGVDIYRFADDLGMSPDEAVQYLKSLDADSKLKKRDLISDDLPKMDEQKYNETLELFRKEFQQTDTAKGIDTLFEDLYGIVNDRNPDNLYSRARQEGDPESFDELLRLAQMDANAQNPVDLPLQEMLRRDPAIREGIQNLFGRPQGAAPQPDQPNVNFDELLAFMNGETAPTAELPPQLGANLEVPGQRPNIDELLRQLSGTPREAEIKPPTPTNEVVEEVSDRPNLLLRGNLQRFNPADTNPMVNVADNPQSEKALDMTKNPVKRGWNKFREHYINRNESFKVAEETVLKNRIESGKAAGEDVSSLERELKSIKKNGSSLEKAIANESAADAQTKNYLDRHFGKMFEAVGGDEKEVSKALEYVMAKRLLWRRTNDPVGMKDYKLPQGWDWERLANVEAAGDGFYDEFVQAVQGAKTEQLDKMLTYGLIDETSYNNLMQDPFYIPMYRDRSFMGDNVDSGWGIGQNSNRRGTDPYVLHEWGDGDTSTFFKNPLETMVSNAYAVNKNALKNDTAQQMLRLAQLDEEGSLFKEITAKEYSQADGGGIEVFVNGEKRYVKPQKDMMDLIKENDAGLVSDMASRITGMVAGLKTRSFEYQTAAALRDTMESYVKSQAGPVQWFQHAYNAVMSKQANAKEVGAYFEHAWKDHFGGINPQEITKEYAKQNKNVKMFDYKSAKDWKEIAKTAGKALDVVFKPSKMLGQYLDNLPREIEVMEATRRFNAENSVRISDIQDEMAKNQQMIEAAQNATGDFADATKGIDNVISRQGDLQAELRQLERDLRRDQIYQGRDIMNYSRTGRGELTKMIRKYVMFANTTTQSKDKMIRSFMERPVATATKAAVAVGPMIAMQRLAFEGMSDDDKETYQNLPNYMKQSNFIFVDKGKVTAIAKPHELALLTNPIEAYMAEEPLNDSLRLIAKELVPYQAGHITQGMVPDEEGMTLLDRDPYTKVPEGVTQPSTLISPVIDIMANDKLGFNRKPISYNAEESNDWTLDVSRSVGGNTPNADSFEYLIRQYLGDAGKYGLYGADAAMDSGNEDKLDELLRNLNPLQDRYFAPGSRYFKEPVQEEPKK